MDVRDPWGDAAADVAEVLQRLAITDAVLVGHSAGGWIAASVAIGEKEAAVRSLQRTGIHLGSAVGGMVLLDPVIQPAESYAEAAALTPDEVQAHNTQRYGGIEKRFNGFESPKAMQERFTGKGPYADWVSSCLEDYCEHGLLTLAELIELAVHVDYNGNPICGEEEGVDPQLLMAAVEALVGADRDLYDPAMVLACPPSFERAWYEGSRSAGIGGALLTELQKFTAPTFVIRSSMTGTNPDGTVNFRGSPTDEHLAERFGGEATDEIAEGRSHFIPMEDPGFVAQRVMEMVERVAGGGETPQPKL